MRSEDRQRVKRWLRGLDWALISSALALGGWGVLMVYSSISSKPNLLGLELHWKQAYWMGYGIAAMVLVTLVDYHWLGRQAYLIYGLAVASLLLVLGWGKVMYGAQRWLALGGVRLQPAEFAKLAVILVLARHFDTARVAGPWRLRHLAWPTALVALPCFLIARQPDLGTAAVIGLVYLVLLLVVGIERRTLLVGVGGGLALLPTGWLLLKEYQKQRILTLLFPGSNPLGAGYQAIQSKIAIGSGGIWGKGLMAGTQSRLHFLPEKHTDFIFSVLAEELGMVGAVALLALLLLFLMRCFHAAERARDKLGCVLGAGIASTFALYVVLNIGMTLGLVPIVGIPLPLLSYGGSATVSTWLSIGILLSIRMRRFTFSPF
ncbi:MAG: rod shape-determining protein RodA [Nitrospinota bacterium]